MKFKGWLVPALIGLGLLLIAISIFGPKVSGRASVSEEDLAFLSEKSGTVLVQNYEMPQAIPLKTNFGLHPKDVVRTRENSEALIQFSNDGQFRIGENSEILLDTLDNDVPVVIVKAGEIFIERFGRAPSFWVRKEGQSLSAVDFALADKKNAPKLKDPLPSKDDVATLTQADIENIMAAKKNDFFKCYGQALQKDASARGQVLISFRIESTGQTSKIEISKSDIPDNSFKTCLLEVVARTQFKHFSGNAINTIFPLKFD